MFRKFSGRQKLIEDKQKQSIIIKQIRFDTSDKHMSAVYDCSQLSLLKKMNAYLMLQDREMRVSLDGYCHGLSLLWIYKMAEGNVEWFYNVVEKLASTPDVDLLDIEIDIEKFLAHIEWCQSSDVYASQGIKISLPPGASEKERKFAAVSQRDINEILELGNAIPKVDLRMKKSNWIELFANHIHKNNQIAVIRSCIDKKHTIAIFPVGNQYVIYDANNPTGRPKETNSPDDLFVELMESFYKRFDIPIPEDAVELECDFIEKPVFAPKPVKKSQSEASKDQQKSTYDALCHKVCRLFKTPHLLKSRESMKTTSDVEFDRIDLAYSPPKGKR